MTRVATYVFLDLETSGLPSYEYNKTKITEISMVAVQRRHLLETKPGVAPRVLDKFTMCFNPRRYIHPDSTAASGLCNDLLEYKTDFNMNVFNTLNGFLACLEKPVCLVAENGFGFDFPILKNHFERLKVSLPKDIMCADSLYAFYDIFDTEKEKEPVATGTPDNPTLSTSISDNETPTQESITEESNKICEDTTRDEVDSDLHNQQLLKQQNERTPRTKPKSSKPRSIDKVKRKLFWGDNPKPKLSYKLKDLYERVVQRPAINAHRAENDCVMTLETSTVKAKEFVEWVDQKMCPFDEVESMRVGVPLR